MRRVIRAVTAAALLAVGSITAFVYGRSQTRESFSVQPTAGRGAAPGDGAAGCRLQPGA